MARRANGEGNFLKTEKGYIYREYFNLPNGDKIRKSFSKKTKRECLEAAKKFEENIGIKITQSKKITLKAWIEEWLNIYKKSTVSVDTFKSYKYDCNIIFKDKISEMLINKINPVHVQGFLNRISHYALSRQKKVRNILRSAFKEAIDNNLCTKNPAINVKLTSDKVKIREAYSDSDVEVIKEFCMIDEFGLEILILLYAGLRRGELLALKWSDYNINEMTITINSTLTISDGIKNGDTSTKKHLREIPIPTFLNDILNNRAKTSLYIASKNPSSYTTISNFRTQYDNFFIRLDNWCIKNEKAVVKKLSPHCLRHTYGTMLYRKGINLKTIQVLMGHSSIDVTANIYTHTDIATSSKAILLAFDD